MDTNVVSFARLFCVCVRERERERERKRERERHYSAVHDGPNTQSSLVEGV